MSEIVIKSEHMNTEFNIQNLECPTGMVSSLFIHPAHFGESHSIFESCPFTDKVGPSLRSRVVTEGNPP